ncbi:MAG: hypothetical protein AAF489_15925 [Bacteroidota bacterium]
MAPHATRSLTLDFATVEVLDFYLVVTMNEGLLFDRSHLTQLYKVFNTYFPDRPFGYISNRINDYTVDPTSYFETKEGPWLAAIAIMCYSEAAYNNAVFERNFYKKRPHKPFYDMEECKKWLKEKVENHSLEKPSIMA